MTHQASITNKGIFHVITIICLFINYISLITSIKILLSFNGTVMNSRLDFFPFLSIKIPFDLNGCFFVKVLNAVQLGHTLLLSAELHKRNFLDNLFIQPFATFENVIFRNGKSETIVVLEMF